MEDNNKAIDITTIRGELVHIEIDVHSLYVIIDGLFVRLPINKIKLSDQYKSLSIDDGSFRFMFGDDYKTVKVLIESNR